MRYTTLVDTATLASHLADPEWLVVDVRSSLADLDYGRNAYVEGHVPGAVFADLNRDLSGEPGEGRGRHPLPDVTTMASRLGDLGVGPDVQVVAYDDADGAYAARLWWMLRYLGHDAVAVLDGGFGAWTAEGRPVASGVERREARELDVAVRSEMAVTADDVDDIRLDASRVLVDSRSPDRYRGANETIDPVAGHIPGARNRFFKANVDSSGRMRDAEALRPELEAALGGVAPERVVVYCGSGVTACQNLLALEHVGLAGAKLYPGSWSEWIADATRPVAVGDAPGA